MRYVAVLAMLGLAVSLAPGSARADWPPMGRVISAAAGVQEGPRTATDGAGGAIVVWHDLRSTKVNLFARRVLASGDLDPAWPIDGRALLTDSTALASAAGGQRLPVIVPDGAIPRANRPR